MKIDWTNFTPEMSLIGGLALGISATIYILINGKIMGISGIVGGMVSPKSGDLLWRITFLLGMLASPLLLKLIVPNGYVFTARIDANIGEIILAGLLVGIGTRYGSGCTSGHGICGLARLSPRSMVATLSFMLSGFVTVYIMRHIF
jgi:hypothetical protein